MKPVLDNIIIIAHTFENHLSNIRKVLEKLRIANLKLNPSKCKLFCREVSYPRHISVKGVQTDPEEISAVKTGIAPKICIR